MMVSSETTHSAFQNRYRTVLFWAAVFLAEYHMFCCAFRHIIPNEALWNRVDRWLGLLLCLFALGYVALLLVNKSAAPGRLKKRLAHMSSYEQWFMVWYFVWYIVSCAVRQHTVGGEHFKTNDWWMYITGLLAFIYFPLARMLGCGRAKKLFGLMLKTLLVPHLLFTAWALWQYMQLNPVIFPSGNMLRMGPWYSLHIGANRNTTGITALTMTCCCLYLAAAEKGWRRIPWLAGVYIYSAVNILSNCRSSWYAYLLLLILLGILLGWKVSAKKEKSLRFLFSLFFAVVLFMLACWLRNFEFQQLNLAMQRLNEASTATSPTFHTAGRGAATVTLNAVHRLPEREYSLIPLAAAASRGLESGLNGRLPIYRASIFVMFTSRYRFLFGVTPADVYDTLKGIYGVKKDLPFLSAHNIFLQMGVSYGVPTMAATMVFMFQLIRKGLRHAFDPDVRLGSGTWLIPLFLICFLAVDMVEAELNSSGMIFCCLFYLFAGWVVALDRERKEQTVALEDS